MPKIVADHAEKRHNSQASVQVPNAHKEEHLHQKSSQIGDIIPPNTSSKDDNVRVVVDTDSNDQVQTSLRIEGSRQSPDMRTDSIVQQQVEVAPGSIYFEDIGSIGHDYAEPKFNSGEMSNVNLTQSVQMVSRLPTA